MANGVERQRMCHGGSCHDWLQQGDHGKLPGVERDVTVRKRLVRRIGVVLLAIVAGACGGGGERSGRATSTTASPTSTTTTVASDPEAERLAAAGLVTVEDLGPPWKVHTEAKGALPPSPDGCASKNGAPTATLAPGAAHQGAALQRGEATRFVTTFTRVFPDEARAQEYVAVFTTEAYLACVREQMTKAETDLEPDGPRLSFRSQVLPLPEDRPQGMEILVQFQFQTDKNGTVEDANGTTHQILARKGRAVLFMTLEEADTDKDEKDINQRVSEEAGAALGKALARLG